MATRSMSRVTCKGSTLRKLTFFFSLYFLILLNGTGSSANAVEFFPTAQSAVVLASRLGACTPYYLLYLPSPSLEGGKSGCFVQEMFYGAVHQFRRAAYWSIHLQVVALQL